MIKRNLFITALILLLFYIIDDYIGFENIPSIYILFVVLICAIVIIASLLKKGRFKSYPIYYTLFCLSAAIFGTLAAIDSVLSNSLPNYPHKGGNIIIDTAIVIFVLGVISMLIGLFKELRKK